MEEYGDTIVHGMEKRWYDLWLYQHKHIIALRNIRKVLRRCKNGGVDGRTIDRACEKVERLANDELHADYWVSQKQAKWDPEKLELTWLEGCPKRII